MTDTENVFDGFALLGDDEEFDVDKIFGSGSDEPAPPPPAPTLAEEVKPQFDPEQVQTETAESQPEPEQTFPAKTQDAPAVRRKAADPDAEEGHRGLQRRIPDAGSCTRIQQGHLPHPLAGRADV